LPFEKLYVRNSHPVRVDDRRDFATMASRKVWRYQKGIQKL